MSQQVATYQFGPYEVRTRTRELYNQGIKLKLRPQAFQVLRALVEHAGDLVTREELRQMLWPGGTFVDFEHGLNSSVKELRRALRDSANEPRYIETLPRRGYRFIAETSPLHEDHPPSIVSHPRIIGRHHLISDILDVWSTGERGARQVLFLSGEPGIGKTTIAQQVLARATAAGTARATWGQCIQHYGIGEPYQPLLDAIMRLCSQPDGADLVPVLERYAPTWLAQLPALLPPERHAALQRTVAGTTPQRMLRELTDALEAAAARIPLVLCLEDLHWSDTSTLDWIAAFAQRPEPTRVLLMGTFRTQTDASGGHPLSRVIDELHIRRCCREITLSGITESDVAEFIALRFPPATGQAAPSDQAPPSGQAHDLRRLALRVHRHTGGNPLFVVNVLDDLVARSLIFEQDGRWALKSDLNEIDLGTPDDIRRIIAAQLERLPPTECTLLEVASVAGGTFSATTVAGAAGLAAEDVETKLTGLAREQRFVRHSGGRFEFAHVLYRDVLYERVSRRRRAILHREVAEREEASHGERACEIAAELAMHFERSGDIRRAGVYLQQAAENARSRSAFSEARTHFQKALALIENEPAGRERTEREIKLWIGLGAAAMAVRGWGTQEAETAYSRARKLCAELGESSELFPALWGLWLFYWGRGPLGTAHELAQDLLALAHARGEDALLLQAHHAAWATAFSTGDLRAACFHAGEGIRLYEAHRHDPIAATCGNHDAGVCARYFLARASVLLGRIGDAVRAANDAIALAEALKHPFSLALAHVFASAVAQACRQPDRVRVHAEAAAEIARDQDFRLLLAWSSAFEGWAAVVMGHRELGLARIANGITEARTMGSEQFLSHLAGVAAEAYLLSGNAADGLESVADGLRVAERTGERFWEPELLRLRGELQILQDPQCATGEAEQTFRKAIEQARSQGATLLALRAAVSLGRSLRSAGRDGEVRSLIFEITAGLDRWTGLDWTGLDIDEATALLGKDSVSFLSCSST
jgi:DNA-binding winged helix-turn-helix (wHTH) protein/predicted ATPase